MKKLITLLTFLLLSTGVMAQSTTRWQPYIRGGVGVSRAIGNEANAVFEYGNLNPQTVALTMSGKDWLSMGKVSVGFTQPLNERFYIQAEAGVERRNARRPLIMITRSCGVAGCYEATHTGFGFSGATYLTVPVLVGYRLRKISLAAGPYLSYKLGEGQYSTLQTASQRPYGAPNFFLINKLNNLDAGFSLAGAYAIGNRVVLDLRYSQGLISLGEKGSVPAERTYNQTAQLGVRCNLLR